MEKVQKMQEGSLERKEGTIDLGLLLKHGDFRLDKPANERKRLNR